MNKKPNNNLFYLFLIFLGFISLPFLTIAQNTVFLKNEKIQLKWEKTKVGYRIENIKLKQNNVFINNPSASGEYTILYTDKKPVSEPNWNQIDEKSKAFSENSYKLLTNRWKQNLDEVALNTAGSAIDFFPANAFQKSNTEARFSYISSEAVVNSVWKLDQKFQSDIIVEIELTAKKDGYFSIASPALAITNEEDIKWGMIPGHFQGKELQKDLVLGYGYGQGIPNRPVIVRERSASTLATLISSNKGFTLAVIPEPGTARDPWTKDKNTQNDWLLGLSLINRNGQITPTAYHPILGQKNSFLKKGEIRVFRFRYAFGGTEWYDVYKHAIYDVYKFSDFLSLKKTNQSLTHRILGMLDYVRKDSSSLWHTYKYKGLEIGAQDYNGSVLGSEKDALKNSDYGAMWMLANITGDSTLINNRLPYARNFKLAQQETENEFFKGAAIGQYYLWKSKRFTEEWGNYVEPIALTYYTMLDIGNILLFKPHDTELLQRLRLGANRLLSWQHKEGNWEVAYDHDTQQPTFTDLKDLRPTFYGLMIAYKFLGEEKYLNSARKGADWFIENAVDKGSFLGVCGDYRFVPDFATGQSVQALLDLYDITKNVKYKDAAIRTARIYTASIYTHPIPNNTDKNINGVIRKDWEISQVGLSFEHGGTLGSAAKANGPILLASHAGMFVRLYDLTKDQLYLDMARAAAWGRDAFVNKENSVASYYWNKMDDGPGRYPHHAWWQVGWITDYLISEIASRTAHQVDFPRGFITPKVGPHQTYGFAPGKVFGNKADLFLPENILKIDNERIDYMCAVNKDNKKLYLILLNNSTDKQTTNIKLNENEIFENEKVKFQDVVLLDHKGKKEKGLSNIGVYQIEIPAYGLKVISFKYQ